MIAPYLREVLRTARAKGDLSQQAMARHLPEWEKGVEPQASTVSRVETGKAGWGLFDRIEETVAAYAEQAGMEPIELWREALKLWEESERAGVEATRRKRRAAHERTRQ